MAITAKARAAGPSYSLFISWAVSISPDMIQARVTEGVKPATPANRNNSGIPTKAERNRFRNVIALRIANKIEI